MLLDEILPHFHKAEYHDIVVDVPADDLWTALERADLGRPLPIKLLMGLRAIPALFSRRGWMRENMKRSGPLRLRDFASIGFNPLGETKHEMVFGIEGRFWQPIADVRPGDVERFREPQPSNTARAAWNFIVTRVDENSSRLATITRVECSDAQSLRSFGRYWFFVQPFSGFIRMVMLRAVAREARNAVGATSPT